MTTQGTETGSWRSYSLNPTSPFPSSPFAATLANPEYRPTLSRLHVLPSPRRLLKRKSAQPHNCGSSKVR
ncbi:hypothetical protein TSMEX_000599, partial [Taenia solium]